MNKKLMSVLSSSIVSAAAMLATTATAQNLYMNDLRLKADIDWLNTQGWDHEPPAPDLPNDIVDRTRQRYLAAHQRLTGSVLD